MQRMPTAEQMLLAGQGLKGVTTGLYDIIAPLFSEKLKRGIEERHEREAEERRRAKLTPEEKRMELIRKVSPGISQEDLLAAVIPGYGQYSLSKKEYEELMPYKISEYEQKRKTGEMALKTKEQELIKLRRDNEIDSEYAKKLADVTLKNLQEKGDIEKMRSFVGIYDSYSRIIQQKNLLAQQMLFMGSDNPELQEAYEQTKQLGDTGMTIIEKYATQMGIELPKKTDIIKDIEAKEKNEEGKEKESLLGNIIPSIRQKSGDWLKKAPGLWQNYLFRGIPSIIPQKKPESGREVGATIYK
jgi:hypothetical protein